MKHVGLIFLLLLMGTVLAFGQNQPVKGIVVDETGETIVGAYVSVKGTSVGTTTDANGKFSLLVPNNTTSLQFTYIGYETLEVPVKEEMTITMKNESQQLDAVVVTGMARIDKRLYTGATDQLMAENVKIDGIPDISRALEGRSAGVSVQNVSGTFGTAPKIKVRGATSIYGSSKPLWVVDGVIMEDVSEVSADALSSGDAVTLISSSIAGLNADDIESFQILKDGSATSIYGARAMPGVIVITTKKGRVGLHRISYTGELTTRLTPSYNDFNIMNSQEQMSVYKEMEEKGWLNFAETYRTSNSGVYGKMYQLINSYDATSGQFGLQNTPEARSAYLREAEMRNTDWFDELFQPSILQNHSVSISSGTQKSTFYASLSAMLDPGWYKKSSVKRYTANLNVTHNISDNLSLNLISSASYRNQTAPGTLAQDVDAVNGEVRRDFDINPYSYALNTSRAMDANTIYTRNYAGFNILHELENNYIDLNVLDTKFQGELRWKPIVGLELSALGAVKYAATAQHQHIKDNSNQAMAYRAMGDATIIENNPYLYDDPDTPYALPITILPSGGIYQRTDHSVQGYDFRTSATYNKIFNNKHITSFYGGMEVKAVDRNKTWFNGWGLQYEDGEIPLYAYQFFKKSIESNSDYYSVTNTRTREAAFFSLLTYSYEGRYTLTGTFRYEGTNRLGKSRSVRWLPTWNVGAAWNIHEEKFFQGILPVVSHAKFRASYSLTADRGPSFVTNSQSVIKSYVPYRPFTGLQESGYEIEDLENSELTFEKKHELNVALETGFFNNRINLVAEWYKRNNFDLIGTIETQGVGGTIIKYANVASMKGGGFEFTLSAKNINKKDFGWNTDLIVAHQFTKVTEMNGNNRLMDFINGTGFTKEGYAYRTLFSIPFEGLDSDGIPTFSNDKGKITQKNIGDLSFQQRTNLDFMKHEGPTDPTYTGSVGNIFRYKNLRLNVFVTYAFGNKVRLDPVFKSRYSDLTSMPKEFKNRWVMPGDEATTNIPVILSRRQENDINTIVRAYNAYNYSDVRVADGDFIRMKEISLAYDLPKKWLDNSINNLSLKIQATNLLLLYADSKLNGQDPEFFRSGGVAAPVPRQFTFTLRMGL